MFYKNRQVQKKSDKKIKLLVILIYIYLIISIFHKNLYFIFTENKLDTITTYFDVNKEIINKQKICVCTLGKEENLYIREYVEHYKKYGVDIIFLYDNNDIDGERFETVIGDYIESGFVKILNWRGEKRAIFKIMNNCYKNNYELYDWLIFYELDEFIHLSNYSNIKLFLNEKKFNKCNLIYLNLICHTDNNLLFYENKSLVERFPETVPLDRLGGQSLEIKCIMRGHIPGIIINNVHGCNYDKKYKNCNGFGNYYKHYNRFATEKDYKYYYIDHYFSKSTEEFINKINKGDAALNINERYNMHRIWKYFSQSNFTEEKKMMIENRTGLNLTFFMNYSFP